MASVATQAAQPADTDQFTPSHWSEQLPEESVAHIPGEAGWPLVGHTLTQLKDPHAFTRGMFEKYGSVYRVKSFGGWNVTLLGADALELVLFNKDKIFSSEQGWGPILDKLFPRGLMLMDFDHHRMDRRALSIAFKPGPMRHYSGQLNAGMARAVAKWGEGSASTRMQFYPAIKQLTLDLAAESFIGLPFGPEADAINQAFVDAVQAAVAPIRKPLPFTQMKRGVDGRAYLIDFFSKETVRRREEGGGQEVSQVAEPTLDRAVTGRRAVAATCREAHEAHQER